MVIEILVTKLTPLYMNVCIFGVYYVQQLHVRDTTKNKISQAYVHEQLQIVTMPVYADGQLRQVKKIQRKCDSAK